MASGDGGRGLRVGGSILGSLRDALAAAGRDDSARALPLPQPEVTPTDDAFEAMKDVTHALDDTPRTTLADPVPPPVPPAEPERNRPPRAAEAAREARGGTPNVPFVDLSPEDDVPPTTGVLRDPVRGGARAAAPADDDAPRTQLVRGKQKVARGDFKLDPVVGWLVVIGGAGLGAFRPIFEGNNTVGRSASNRIAIDFGDETISNDEQAYIRYDSADRSFLFVPNLAKTNVVSVNDKRPAQPVRLVAMDLITMGRTQLVFVPFCGADFDWGDLSELNR